MKFVVPALALALGVFSYTPAHAATTANVPNVPFYSQFADISSPKWQKVGCGIASLAMVVGYYKDDAVSVNALLKEGLALGAYSDAGWTYSGLIAVARKHGLTGTAYDLSGQTSASALNSMTAALAEGPVIASVHYKFEPTNPIPHLVVIDAIKNGTVYYNDPAAKAGQKTLSTKTFLAAWKKRYIVIRPAGALALR